MLASVPLMPLVKWDSNFSWHPQIVNRNCPLLVLAESGNAGFGDQLERYIYTLNVAKLLHATLSIQGFTNNGSSHEGSQEYSTIARLLNINLVDDLMSARSSYLRQFYLTFDGVIDVRKNLQSGKAYRNLHCNTFIESFIMSCNDKWCLDSHPFDFFSDISWILRNNTARLQCQSEIQPPEDNESNAVNIVWHIRTGDICLHCNDIEYFQSTWSLVSNAVGNNSGNVNLAFHSQSDVPWLKPFFPQATFSINSTLLYTVCSFFTSDIFITSGSALGSITAFAPPWFPVVFEEKRKNVTPARHLLTKHDAIQLDNGHPIHHSKDEIFSIVQTALRTKSSLQRVSRPRSKQQCEN